MGLQEGTGQVGTGQGDTGQAGSTAGQRSSAACSTIGTLPVSTPQNTCTARHHDNAKAALVRCSALYEQQCVCFKSCLSETYLVSQCVAIHRA